MLMREVGDELSIILEVGSGIKLRQNGEDKLFRVAKIVDCKYNAGYLISARYIVEPYTQAAQTQKEAGETI